MKEEFSIFPGLYHPDRALRSQTSLSLVAVSAASLGISFEPRLLPTSGRRDLAEVVLTVHLGVGGWAGALPVLFLEALLFMEINAFHFT